MCVFIGSEAAVHTESRLPDTPLERCRTNEPWVNGGDSRLHRVQLVSKLTLSVESSGSVLLSSAVIPSTNSPGLVSSCADTPIRALQHR